MSRRFIGAYVALVQIIGVASPADSANFSDRALKQATKDVRAMQRSTALGTDPKDVAVREAPAEVVAARAIEDMQARGGEALAADAATPTPEDIRSATSLLDAEPAVQTFHTKVRNLVLPPAPPGTEQLENARIYKGAAVGGFRRVVILADIGGNPVCTGTLVNSQYVLTAAHCLCERGSAVPSPTRLAKVAYGSTVDAANVLGDIDPSKTKWMGNGSVCSGSRQDPDVAVVGFAQPKLMGFPPLQFADDAQIDSTEALRVIGFGRSDTSASSSGTKRSALVPVVSKNCTGEPQATPGRSFASVFECVEGREIVAGRFGGADTCRGDSGGPAFIATVTTAADVFPDDIPVADLRIAGITSRGIKTPSDSTLDDCGYGGIYVRVSGPVRTFIRTATAL